MRIPALILLAGTLSTPIVAADSAPGMAEPCVNALLYEAKGDVVWFQGQNYGITSPIDLMETVQIDVTLANMVLNDVIQFLRCEGVPI